MKNLPVHGSNHKRFEISLIDVRFQAKFGELHSKGEQSFILRRDWKKILQVYECSEELQNMLN